MIINHNGNKSWEIPPGAIEVKVGRLLKRGFKIKASKIGGWKVKDPEVLVTPATGRKAIVTLVEDGDDWATAEIEIASIYLAQDEYRDRLHEALSARQIAIR